MPFRILATVIAALIPISAHAAVNKKSCLGDFAVLIEGSISSEAARKIQRAYAAYNPAAQKGLLAIIAAEPAVARLDPDVLEDIYGNFPRGVELDINPLRTDEGLFEAIGELTDQGADGVLRMREGLTDTIRDLGVPSGATGTAQGATFDLFMARSVGYSRTKSLQQRIPVPGTTKTRKTDLLEECPVSCGGLEGIHHENKNFTSPIFASSDELTKPIVNPENADFFKYGDAKLDTLAREFAEDILIHQGTSFDFYRLNFREFTNTAEQLDVLTKVLSKQFDSPLVSRAIIDPVARDGLRRAFLGKFAAVVSFFP